MTKTYRRVLTIAGSDSGGGAGIQADLKTISANGCYAMSVITALTAQNTVGVTGIHPVPVDFVCEQLDAVLSDIGVDAIKIGMLFSPELIIGIADKLRSFEVDTIVLDPVMVAQSGDKLLQDEAIDALKQHLIPMATLITPNLPEASELLGYRITSLDMPDLAARQLCELGCRHVLLKGGHLETENSDDCLYNGLNNEITFFPAKRITTNNNHGTGCTLSSAIASQLALGKTVENAVAEAKQYVHGAIQAGAEYTIGHGHGPVHHFYRFY
ncbi:bifunctional hydroxymethylpyrimidine kinase/phosphomethylpyrimidine kinase [Desulfogranum japonicum]|uniref:bifunctional hydroxymethylpyrimidine kinase/phosphomethylpyrimidine kinase n=1 Tax=Desulfogranum japonicum TaxID=231447 RepID=UPI00040A0CC3|nr:bifunctional hydroxymethylpyrimidine kinase/phosphomethylpyrimidine kinase [Desulfogranum japonicum]